MRRALLLLVTACGASSTPAGDTAAGPAVSIVATPASADDAIVATVNGQPVYGSCVVAQAARGATKQDALNQCIDFELLAQVAHARQLETDSEVVLRTRTALVSQLVAREFEDKLTKPADFGAFWQKSLERNRLRIDHGEARASAYVRINVKRDAPPEQSAPAQALIEEVAAALGKEQGLTAAHLKEMTEKIIAGRAQIASQVVPAYLNNGGLDAPYAQALFAIPEVGRTSPAVRTKFGWDVVLLTELIPAEKLTEQEIVEKLLPDIKRSYFTTWADQVASALGVRITRFADNIAKLEDL